MSSSQRPLVLIRRETEVETYEAAQSDTGVVVDVNGTPSGVFETLPAAMDAYPKLTSCVPDDAFVVDDEPLFRAALRVDDDAVSLPSTEFAIVVNDHTWDLGLEADFGYSLESVVAVDDGGVAGAALFRIGPWLENYVPELPEETYLWRAPEVDPHREATDWLARMWLQGSPDDCYEGLNVISEHLDDADIPYLVTLFSHLLTSGGDLNLNGTRIFVKPDPGGQA